MFTNIDSFDFTRILKFHLKEDTMKILQRQRTYIRKNIYNTKIIQIPKDLYSNTYILYINKTNFERIYNCIWQAKGLP